MWKDILNAIVTWVTTAGLKIVIALIVLVITYKIINRIARNIEKAGQTGKLDKTISKVFSYIFKIGLKCIVAISLVGFVGIDTSGLAALVTSVGVCAGLALNGTLSNLAGGVLIIITRPFKVDDYIEAQGYSGTVEDIRITYTRICTPDNKVIYLPNGALSSGTVVNYSEKDTRRVELIFSIAYDSDVEKAKRIINKVINAHELALKTPEPFVRVKEHSDSSIKIVARVWTKSADYWTVHFDLLENVKSLFDAAGIETPYNQLDVHIKND